MRQFSHHWNDGPHDQRSMALLIAALLLSLPGCAYFQSEIVDPPPMNDPFAPAPVWGGTTNVFGTPTWSSGSNNFTMPAWGGPPPLYGTRLGVPPGESPAAKALALTEQLTASKSENEQLTTRVRGLEAEVAASNQALARATTEVVETRTELAHARTDLEQWKQEVATLREKLVAAEKENLSTLQSTVGLVQQLMTQEQQPAEGE